MVDPARPPSTGTRPTPSTWSAPRGTSGGRTANPGGLPQHRPPSWLGAPTQPLDVHKDGRNWRIGTASDVAWLAGHTRQGLAITTAIPEVFDAYATFHPPEGVGVDAHEQAVVRELTARTAEQRWWLGYLDTGAHDVVFPRAPRVSLYWGWPYVLVEAGPEQALTWRTGHMRGDGPLPDLFFPADHSWLVSALWDDTWTDVGGSAAVIAGLQRNPLVSARRVRPDEDACPPGLTRD